MDNLYSFIYRGILTEEALDKVGRAKRKMFGANDIQHLKASLCFDLLDSDCIENAHYMSVVYIAIHSFENMVRNFVKKAMAENYKEIWWDKVPEKIQKSVKIRMEDDAKYRWHGVRGTSEMNYCDFGDLTSIIITNWNVFEDVLPNQEWAKAVLSTLERSRNIIMHSGFLAKEDIERIGINIRDWVRQTG